MGDNNAIFNEPRVFRPEVMPGNKNEPYMNTYSAGSEVNFLQHAELHDHPTGVGGRMKDINLMVPGASVHGLEEGSYHLKVTLKPKAPTDETKISVRGENVRDTTSIIHVTQGLKHSGIVGTQIDGSDRASKYEECGLSGFIRSDEEDDTPKERVYTWIRPAGNVPDHDTMDDDSGHGLEQMQTLKTMQNNSAPPEDKAGRRKKEKDDDPIADIPSPVIVYAGTEYDVPHYAGRLDPKGFTLHAIEIHQHLDLPSENGAKMNAVPWFVHRDLDLQKNCTFGPIALPWDPSNTGMISPMISPLPKEGGKLQPRLSDAILDLFTQRLPVGSIRPGLFPCCTVIKAGANGVPMSRTNVPFDDGLMVFDPAFASSESVAVEEFSI